KELSENKSLGSFEYHAILLLRVSETLLLGHSIFKQRGQERGGILHNFLRKGFKRNKKIRAQKFKARQVCIFYLTR
ncbi:hypothetical protein P4H46_26845, partial [Paenibacillus glucanolyticus]|uniref:hypothetical protein n=1 Tax=Paenibacillus glucanolyticus TaxID=59843 RepID=UPI0030C9B254